MPIITYPEFLSLVKNSEFIATDGASNQFEAYLMGKPCILLRDFTEQIEGLDRNVVLYKSDEKRLINFLRNYKKYRTKPVVTKVKPSRIIADCLLKLK
jgi:UDP-N-acetylglucosamine 2-epimerase (non-hydrolysing)